MSEIEFKDIASRNAIASDSAVGIDGSGNPARVKYQTDISKATLSALLGSSDVSIDLSALPGGHPGYGEFFVKNTDFGYGGYIMIREGISSNGFIGAGASGSTSSVLQAEYNSATEVVTFRQLISSGISATGGTTSELYKVIYE